jgi:hypothetical protein
MAEPAVKAELMRSLGRLVRGLSALFWGLPLALVLGVQTARTDWLRPLGFIPPLAATVLLFFGLRELEHFQKQERPWRASLEQAKLLGLITIGLSPFLYWWHKQPQVHFFAQALMVLAFSGLLFLLSLNQVLQRLTALLPDETLRLETRLFATLNRYWLASTLLLLALGWFSLVAVEWPPEWGFLKQWINPDTLWLIVLATLLPLATTMALLWKIKEVILASVFGPE